MDFVTCSFKAFERILLSSLLLLLSSDDTGKCEIEMTCSIPFDSATDPTGSPRNVSRINDLNCMYRGSDSNSDPEK